MKIAYKWMLVIFLIVFIIKSILSYFVASPTIFLDEYVYSKMARSVYLTGSLAVDGIPTTSYPPLYPIILSVAYFFNDMTLAYIIMKIINAFVSSMIIVPAYLLFREFFDEKISRLGTILVGFAPFGFAASPYLMSENLFAPLFLASVYFILKTSNDNRWVFSILAGAFIGLTILTRYLGFVLLIGAAAVLLIKENRTRMAKRFILISLIAAVIILPFIAQSYIQGETVVDLVSKTVIKDKSAYGFFEDVLALLLWCLAHITYLLLASGGLLGLYALVAQVNDGRVKSFLVITLAMVVSVIAVLSKRALNVGVKEITLFAELPGRIIGRYLDFLIPLVIIVGYLGLIRKEKDAAPTSLTMSAVSLIVIAGSLLFYFPLFPFNNLSLSFFGAIKTGFEYLASGNLSVDYVSLSSLLIVSGLTIATLWVLSMLMKKSLVTMKTAFAFTFVFFLASSSISYAATIYRSSQWNDDEQMTLGRYANQIGGDLVVDKDNCGDRLTLGDESVLCRSDGGGSFVGFWASGDVRIASVEDAKPGNLVVTRKILGYELLKETAGGIRLYRKN